MTKSIAVILCCLIFCTIGLAQQVKTADMNRPPEGWHSSHHRQWLEHRDYQRSPKMVEPLEKPIPLVKKESPPSREVFGYLPYWTYDFYPNLNYDLLTTIAYFGVDIDAFGNLINLHNWPATALINMAHSNGVQVVLTVVLFNSIDLATLLSTPSYRSNLIDNLLQQVELAGADGVSIDFELVPSGQEANLTTFMQELTSAFHGAMPGSFVTIFTPAVDWSNVYDYNALADITDGLIMQGYDYHWSTSPTAGPPAPLTGNRWGFANVSWTVNDYLDETQNNVEKLILSVPFFGLEWPTFDDGLESPTLGPASTILFTEAYANGEQYGRIWDEESQTPWYAFQDITWFQGWYDDSLSLSLKFDFVNEKNLKGIGIWALSYDGFRPELQGAISDAFGSTAPPLRPTSLRVVNSGNAEVEIAVNSASGATGYVLYQSLDGTTFDSGVEFPNSTIQLSTLSEDTTYYFKVSAINGNGESNNTEVLGVRPSTAPVDVLIVNGFDRTIGTVNTFDFIKRFAPSLTLTGHAFDACSNEALIDGNVVMTDYDIVLWISGEEGTADESFGAAEQSLVAAFLESGGKFFASGSEIGYDLVAQGTSSDKTFYETYLKALYVQDDTGTHTASGESATIFDGLANMTFDDGNDGTYDVDFPDGILGLAGAQFNMTYNGVNPLSGGAAGIKYEGGFGSSNTTGRLVYLGVPFETFYPASTRDAIMAAVIGFFDSPLLIGDDGNSGLPGTVALFQNYPNPFNPETHFGFRISDFGFVSIKIYDMQGRLVKTAISKNMAPGSYTAHWDGTDESGAPVASGVYFYRLLVKSAIGNRHPEMEQTRKMILLR